jgi:hypothetical protein
MLNTPEKKILLDVDQTLLWNDIKGDRVYNESLIQALKDTGNTSVVLFTSMNLTADTIVERLRLIGHLHKQEIVVENLLMNGEDRLKNTPVDSKNTTVFKTAISKPSFGKIHELNNELENEVKEEAIMATRTKAASFKDYSKSRLLDKAIELYPNCEFLLIDDNKNVIEGCIEHAAKKKVVLKYILNKKRGSNPYDLGHDAYIQQLVYTGYVAHTNNNDLTNKFTTEFKDKINKNWLDNLSDFSDPMVRNPIIIGTIFIALGVFLAFYNLPIFALFAANKVLTIAGATCFGMLLGQLAYKFSYNKKLNAKFNYLKINKNHIYDIFTYSLRIITLWAKKTHKLNDISEFIVHCLSVPIIATAAIITIGIYANLATMLIVSSAIVTFLLTLNIYYNFHDAKRSKAISPGGYEFLPSIILAGLFYLVISANFLTSPLIAYLFASNPLLLFGWLFVASFVTVATFEKIQLVLKGEYKDSLLTNIVKFILFGATSSLIIWAALAYFPQLAIIEIIKDLLVPVIMLFYIALSTTCEDKLSIDSYNPQPMPYKETLTNEVAKHNHTFNTGACLDANDILNDLNDFLKAGPQS